MTNDDLAALNAKVAAQVGRGEGEFQPGWPQLDEVT